MIKNSCSTNIHLQFSQKKKLNNSSGLVSRAHQRINRITMQSNHIMINTLCNIIIFVSVSSALKCYQCGNYNDGVGSITPCTNYSESIAHLYLRDCQNPSDMFCVVSDLLYIN